jgi:CDP-diacylglycerol pyrophosphatase
VRCHLLHPMSIRLALLALAVMVGYPAGPAAAQRATPAAPLCVVAPRPDSLWSLAQCCARSLASDPDCRSYSKTRSFVILKDNSPRKPDGYLIIPTARVTGIEDPHVFSPPVADLWAFGWQEARTYVRRPASDSGLAINSVFGRTQNQLHIHISCLRRDVAEILARNEASIGEDPATPFEARLPPHGNPYRVVEVTSLLAESPFDVVAAMPGARPPNMAQQSIAVAGSRKPGVWFVLDTWHHDDDAGAAEELLDQTCSGSD